MQSVWLMDQDWKNITEEMKIINWGWVGLGWIRIGVELDWVGIVMIMFILLVHDISIQNGLVWLR